MRYRQGTIAISGEFDIPLLLLIRNSGYITHQQLIALSGHDQSASKYSIFLESFGHSLALLNSRTQVICHPPKMITASN